MPSEVDVGQPHISLVATSSKHRHLVDLLTTTANSATSISSQPVTDLEIIEKSIRTVSSMLDRVLAYVRAVLSGERKGDPAIGRYLMDTLGASTEDLEKGSFAASLQVRLPTIQSCNSIDYLLVK